MSVRKAVGSHVSETGNHIRFVDEMFFRRDWALESPLFLSIASICLLPSCSPSCPGVDRYFCTPSFLVIWHRCHQSELPLTSGALERRAKIATQT